VFPSVKAALSGNNDKAVEKMGCGGFVKVTVKDDFTHDLGIKGQKVLVEIVH
jgi:hypothetical protein